MDILVKHGANLNAQDKDGLTPAMAEEIDPAYGVAFYKVNHLIKLGAKVNITDKQRQNVLFKRLQKGNYEPADSQAVLSDEHWRMRYVEDEVEGLTPLMTLYSNSEIVQKLLDAGADVNAKDTNGHTVRDYIQNDPVLQWNVATRQKLLSMLDAGLKEPPAP